MVYIAKERLHLARDGKTVVKPGDPRSASLLINEGGQMSDEDARKYGLLPPKGGTEDALPLDPRMKTGEQTKPQGTGVSAPVGTSVADKSKEGFAQNLRFGGQTSQPPPPPPSLPAGDQGTENNPPPPPQGAEQPSGTDTPPPPPGGGEDTLPDDFPYKSILAEQGFGTKAAVKAASKDQLLGLKQIGSERADAIMAAAEKL